MPNSALLFQVLFVSQKEEVLLRWCFTGAASLQRIPIQEHPAHRQLLRRYVAWEKDKRNAVPRVNFKKKIRRSE